MMHLKRQRVTSLGWPLRRPNVLPNLVLQSSARLFAQIFISFSSPSYIIYVLSHTFNKLVLSVTPRPLNISKELYLFNFVSLIGHPNNVNTKMKPEDQEAIKTHIKTMSEYVVTALCDVENVANQTISDQPATGNFILPDVKAPDDK